jgi:hypothetical protein
MNHSHATGQQRRAEELVSWTCGERIRFLWYRLCLTVQEMACAAGQMTAFPMGLTPPDIPPPAAPYSAGSDHGDQTPMAFAVQPLADGPEQRLTPMH